MLANIIDGKISISINLTNNIIGLLVPKDILDVYDECKICPDAIKEYEKFISDRDSIHNYFKFTVGKINEAVKFGNNKILNDILRGIEILDLDKTERIFVPSVGIRIGATLEHTNGTRFKIVNMELGNKKSNSFIKLADTQGSLYFWIEFKSLNKFKLVEDDFNNNSSI